MLSVGEAAASLGVSRRTLRRLLEQGTIPSVAPSPRRRVVDLRDVVRKRRWGTSDPSRAELVGNDPHQRRAGE
jgi:excisionase family DNA binding protein